jgi:hypothetical protein
MNELTDAEIQTADIKMQTNILLLSDKFGDKLLGKI